MSYSRNAAPAELFLSHSSRDARFVKRLARVLKHHEVDTFLSGHDIRGAREWHDQVGEALRRCDWFLVVLSPDSVRSKWVKYELIYALQERQYNQRILPILYKSCNARKLSWALPAFQVVDFRKNFDHGCRELFAAWGLVYAPEPKRTSTRGRNAPT